MCQTTHYNFIPCLHLAVTLGRLCPAARERTEASSKGKGDKAAVLILSRTLREEDSNATQQWPDVNDGRNSGHWLDDYGKAVR
jgi:hypothetical protein